MVQHSRANRKFFAPCSGSTPIGRTPVLTWAEGTTFTGDKVGEPAQSIGVTRQSEYRQQSFLGKQHSRLEYFHRRRERLSARPLHQLEQPRLFRDIPF